MKYLLLLGVLLVGCDTYTGIPNVQTVGDITLRCSLEGPRFICKGVDSEDVVLEAQGPKGDVGAQGLQGVQGSKGDMGEPGPQGTNAKDCLFLTIDTVEKGECVFLGDDVWTKMNGTKVDIFNNAGCIDGPDPAIMYCTIQQNQYCWVGTNRIEMMKNKIYKLNIHPDCVVEQ